MKKILVYDDEGSFRDRLRTKLTELPIVVSKCVVETLDNSAFGEMISQLHNRQLEFRETGSWNEASHPLDDVAIFVVDYDLLRNEEDPFLTGETVAYLARCFSRCGLIVAVNQYRYDFDLTLRGHPESFADLNITDAQLDNPNLWGDSVEGFHPWYWPILPEYQDGFEERIIDVKKHLDEPICEALGFTQRSFAVLPRSVSEYLNAKKQPSTVTFREFTVESGNGLRRKDTPESADDEVLARIAAARVSKWLERLVLSEQDILVDAPHLLLRYPSLLTGNTNDIGAWNSLAQRTGTDGLGLKVEVIEECRFEKYYWVSRPVWFWEKVRECRDILEVREPWKTEQPDWVFCEDASRFYDEDYREFVAATESPYSRRFVRYFDAIKYNPVVRFSM